MNDIREDFTAAIGTPGGESVRYDIWADGYIEQLDTGETGDSQPTSYHVSGLVDGGFDHFAVQGTISDIRTDKPGAVVKLNGDRVSVTELRSYVPDRQRDTEVNDDEPPSVDDPPESAPDEHSLTPTAPDIAEGGGTFHEIAKGNQEPQNGIVSRYETSVGPIHLAVDENENGAFQTAMNRLPKEPKHEVGVSLTDGVHDGNGSAIQTGFIRIFPKSHITIASKSGDRDQCISKSGINSVSVGKLGHYRYNDIDFQNLSQFSGPARIQGCGFQGFDEPGKNSDSTAALSGKNALLFMKDCRIGSDSDDYSIHSIQWERYAVYGSHFNAKQQALKQQDACMLVSGWGNTSAAEMFSQHAKTPARGIYAGGYRIW